MTGPAAGVFLPRWREHQPAADESGIGEHEVTGPPELMPALARQADRLAVPVEALVAAAHAKVLATLAGSPEVVTGYVAAAGSRPRPCRLVAGPGSWRSLVLDSARAVAEPALGTASDLTTVLDPTGTERELGPAVVLSVSRQPGSRLRLRFRYRTGSIDAGFAARVAGYYLAALRLIAADLEAEHHRQSLLDPAEVRFQLAALAGPAVELPDRRAHELFEEQAAAHPDAIAVVAGTERCSYRELDRRANRLAHALLAAGLRREDVVAVLTGRSIDWLAAVLAVFKAGGVYLPIEPGFPPERIAAMISRAGCRLVLTDRGEQYEPADGGIRTISIESVPSYPEHSPAVRVTADQLAYIYFTSGSTGQPKGAMCEHAGMLNHLLAKIADLRIAERQVVAQTAPQCFDISMWQLLSALLVGGRTVLIGNEKIQDAQAFLQTVAAAEVAVLQVVPSYLEVLLSELARRPRELAALRCVSVTGEAVKQQLVQRWFAAMPEVELVNAYGLTETSDDTNHEVMTAAPEGGTVPLGRPIQNVAVYVVDDQLSLVPLGAPGEIVFSGICVGRGYVNDPEATRQSFLADPHRPGNRLYRSGDYGRWLPGGRLEFLGRRDNQVKVSGFRIELGEVENALLRIDGVRDAAVVVIGSHDAGRRLAAFYSGRQPVADEAIRAGLRRTLPDYLIPSAFRWLARLPLTGNGKIDRAALVALAGTDAGGAEPLTATECQVAQAWAQVLDLAPAEIGRRDNFFSRGGTSISAVMLAIALDRRVTVAEVAARPVLADLADLIDQRAGELRR